MRFAIATIDPYLSVFQAFLVAGWEPVKVFTVPISNSVDSHTQTLALADKHGVKVQLSRMTKLDLQDLQNQGCEVLVVASYNWKIDDWRPYLKYAVNFHPSPLPEGRGPYPLVRAILERRTNWAMTCHRLVPEIDKGEILAAENFPLQMDESHETLRLKVQMAGGRLASRVAGQFEQLWSGAKDQGGGSYWPRWNNFDRLINFGMSVDDIMCQVRAFGSFESLVSLNNQVVLSVKHATGWTEAHPHPPGHIISATDKTIIIAARDGYIGILEWQFAPPDVTADVQASLAQEKIENLSLVN